LCLEDEELWGEDLKIKQKTKPLIGAFKKIQNFPKVILNPGENLEFDLKEFFRGQLLQYKISGVLDFDSLHFA